MHTLKSILATTATAAVLLVGGALPASAEAAPAPAPTSVVQGAVIARADSFLVAQPGKNSAGTIGMSRMNGSTFDLGFWSSVKTPQHPDGRSIRAVKTGKNWCVREQVVYKTSYWGNEKSKFYVHPYTTTNGGWRTTGISILSATKALPEGAFAYYRLTRGPC